MGLTTGNRAAKIMGIIFIAINKLVIGFYVVRVELMNLLIRFHYQGKHFNLIGCDYKYGFFRILFPIAIL